jgi:hypothetical protein
MGSQTFEIRCDHEALQFSLAALVSKSLAGGSDAAPTGPQASKSVHRVIGHELNLTKMQLRGKGEPSYFLVTLAGERRIHPTELVSGG